MPGTAPSTRHNHGSQSMTFEFLERMAGIVWRSAVAGVGILIQIIAALLLLFEEWGWRPLSEALARLTRFRLWSRVEGAIAKLPPYAALAAIALPSAFLFPLKFVAIWLIANGYVVGAAALLIAAKIVSTALIARIFLLVKPALMQIGWFAALYGRLVPWKEAVFQRIRATWVWRYGRMLKSMARHEARRAWSSYRPTLAALWIDAKARLAADWSRLRSALSGRAGP